jgi:hypothetical protein
MVHVPVKGNDGPTKAIPAIPVILRNIQRGDLTFADECGSTQVVLELFG